MTKKEKIKWLFTIAGKNAIKKESVYEYIMSKHGKEHVRDLSAGQLDDVLAYVSDSRMVTLEKQIYVIKKMADGLGMSEQALCTIAKRHGAQTLEELNEKGIRGVLATVSSMVGKDARNRPAFTLSKWLSLRIGHKDAMPDNPLKGEWVIIPHPVDKIYAIHRDYCDVPFGKIISETVVEHAGKASGTVELYVDGEKLYAWPPVKNVISLLIGSNGNTFAIGLG